MAPAELHKLAEMHKGTLFEWLEMKVVEMTTECVVLTMPVTRKVHQPYGLLHGGISATLVESAASMAAALNCKENQTVAGVEVNCSHLKAKREGLLTATALPLHRGSTIHVWEVKLMGDEGLVAIGRCTIAIREKR